jgi:hypothetical protein
VIVDLTVDPTLAVQCRNWRRRIIGADVLSKKTVLGTLHPSRAPVALATYLETDSGIALAHFALLPAIMTRLVGLLLGRLRQL